MAVGIYKPNYTETKIRYIVLGKEHGLCWSLVRVVLGFFLSLWIEGKKTLEKRGLGSNQNFFLNL